MDSQAGENFLQHYGVLGMKWGKRKSRSRDHSTVQTLKKKTAKELNNADLKKAIARMKLEKQYKDLNPKGLTRGQKAVVGILAGGTTINGLIALNNSPAGKLVKAGIKKAWSK